MRELTSDEVEARVTFGRLRPREESTEAEEWGHGAFTKVILEAFGDPSIDVSADGILSIDELKPPLDRRVTELAAAIGEEQHPVVCRPRAVDNFPFFTFTAPKKTAALRPPS